MHDRGRLGEVVWKVFLPPIQQAKALGVAAGEASATALLRGYCIAKHPADPCQCLGADEGESGKEVIGGHWGRLMKTGTGTASNGVFHEARIRPVAEPVPMFTVQCDENGDRHRK